MDVDEVVVVDVLVAEQFAGLAEFLFVFHEAGEVDEEGEFVVAGAVDVVFDGLDLCEYAVAAANYFCAVVEFEYVVFLYFVFY